MIPNEPTLSQRQVLSPTALVAAARDLLERGLPLLWLEAEVSNFMRAKSGHLYFTLKDTGAQVRCAMFRQRAMHLRFSPADGQQVLVRARVTLYEPRGEFQLQIEHMEEAGLGVLQRQFDELRLKLENEGLFAADHKQSLPLLPRRLAVITSATGAAIRDVLAVLRRRFPLVEVDLFPSLVQGNEAPAGLRRTLAAAERAACYDVILLTRGGGSIEDLWAFNDEALARMIHDCRTPVVSAVGHEVDFTIADFVADLRAATPSAAAELIVPEARQLERRLAEAARAIEVSHSRLMDRHAQRLDSAHARLRAWHPLSRLAQMAERLRNLRTRLNAAVTIRLTARRSDLRLGATRLQHQHPRLRLLPLRGQHERARDRMHASMALTLQRRAERLRTLARTLNALNPMATLERGYAIVFDAEGAVLRSSHGLSAGAQIRVRLADGEFSARLLDRNRLSDN